MIISAVLIAGLAGLYIFLNRPGTVIITSESGAKLSIATEKGGTFRPIGTSTARYSSRSVPVDVYVMAELNGKKTITSSQLERGKTRTITLGLSHTKTAQKIADGAYSDVLYEGTLGQGIVPDDYSITSFKTDNPNEPIRPELVGIPYAKKAIWINKNTVVYNSFRDGVGRLVDGQLLYSDGIASSISGKDLREFDPDTASNGVINLLDVDKSADKPMVFLSANNIFISSDLGTSLQSIVGFDADQNTRQSLFTSKQHIYRFVADEPAQSASEGDRKQSKKQSDEHTGKLYQYTYDGELHHTYDISAESLVAITEKGNTTYILTKEALYTATNGVMSSVELYFTYARDITLYQDRIVMLGDNGLWQIDDSGTSVQLIYEFTGSGVGLEQSFSVSGTSLIFGTQPRPTDTDDHSKTFAITL